MAADFLDPTDSQALAARLLTLAADAPRHWGTMSAQQMLVHCADQLRISRGEKAVTSVRLPGFIKPLAKWLIVSRNQEFKRGMRTLKEMDANAGLSALTTFEGDREALLELLAPGNNAGDGVEHPLFGYLSRREFGEVTWKHLDHHLRQFGA